MTALVLAALGSSFAAGPGIPPVVDEDAMRSGRNYPHLAAELLGAELVDLTVSGATTATILTEPQETMTGTRFAPQIIGLPADADLVTITAGGNDLDYVASMLFAALRRSTPGSPILAMLSPAFPDGIRAPSPRAVRAASDGLARIVEEVRLRAPSARPVLVDYLTVTGPGIDASATPFAPNDLVIIRALQADLESAFVRAAERTGADLVAASQLSRAHGLGTEQPWVQAFDADPARMAGSFHPSEQGMRAVAAAVAELVG